MVEVEVRERAMPSFEIVTNQGIEEMDINVKDMLSGFFGQQKKKRKMTVAEAFDYLIQEEENRLVDMDHVTRIAVERVEQMGILFIDEIDKIAGRESGHGPDVSREGVQRDILPIVEGTTVNTRYGMVRTDHILFIAAGAFHTTKPSDLIPELQGRFPIRVELSSLSEADFVRILTEPKNALIKQSIALLETEGMKLTFSDDGVAAIARFAALVNEQTENIGARRLHTILEKVLEEISFDAPEMKKKTIKIDAGLRAEATGGHRKESRFEPLHSLAQKIEKGKWKLEKGKAPQAFAPANFRRDVPFPNSFFRFPSPQSPQPDAPPQASQQRATRRCPRPSPISPPCSRATALFSRSHSQRKPRTPSRFQPIYQSRSTGQLVPAAAKPSAVPPPFSQRDLAVTIPSAMVNHYADAGHFEFRFELKTASIAEAPGEQTVFMVRTRVNQKKVSADSNPATVHLHEPFPPATNFSQDHSRRHHPHRLGRSITNSNRLPASRPINFRPTLTIVSSAPKSPRLRAAATPAPSPATKPNPLRI